MVPALPHPSLRAIRRSLVAVIATALCAGAATVAVAAGSARAATAGAEEGPTWSQLSPANQRALAPLKRDWPTIDAPRKQKWLDVAARMPGMPAEQQSRVQERMAEWAKMSPEARGQARIGFQESKVVPAERRREQWDAYQALSPEEKQRLAAKAASAPASASAARAPRPKPVAPTIVQAHPGATTTLMSRRPQPGASATSAPTRIATTPAVVDRSTLLPRRPASGAAASSPAPR